jgi:hypothetical protein
MQSDESVPKKENSVALSGSSNWRRTAIIVVVTALFAGTVGYLLGVNTNQATNSRDISSSVSVDNNKTELSGIKEMHTLRSGKKFIVFASAHDTGMYVTDNFPDSLGKEIFHYTSPAGADGIIDFEESNGFFAISYTDAPDAIHIKLFDSEGKSIPVGVSDENKRKYQADRENVVGTVGMLGSTEFRFSTYKSIDTLEIMSTIGNEEYWLANYEVKTGRYIDGSFRRVKMW